MNNFSTEIGEKLSRIKSIETNRQKVPVEILPTIVKKFNISPLWLLTGEGQMYVNPHTDQLPEQQSCNLQLIRRIIRAVEGVLSEEKIQATPDKKAQLITTLYNFYTVEGKDPTKPSMQIMRDLVKTMRN